MGQISNAIRFAWRCYINGDIVGGTPHKAAKGDIWAAGDLIDALVEDLRTRVDAVESIGFTTFNFVPHVISARAAANVNLATGLVNGQTLNGVTVATGKYYLLLSQTNGATVSETLPDGTVITNSPDNGPYIGVASGTATRATWADVAAELAKIGLFVAAGTLGKGEKWVLNLEAADIPSLGTTKLPFSLYTREPDNSTLIADIGTNPAGAGASPSLFTQITKLLNEGLRQRGTIANNLNTATISAPGVWLAALNTGLTQLPADFNHVANNGYLIVLNPGNADGTGSPRFFTQIFVGFGVAQSTPTGVNPVEYYKQIWIKTVDSVNPTSTSVGLVWQPIMPKIAGNLLHNLFDYRGTSASPDYNTLGASGLHLITGTPTNAPPGLLATSALLEVKNFSPSFRVQTAYSVTDPNWAVTRINNGAWGPLGHGLARGKKIVCLGDSTWMSGGGQAPHGILARLLSATTVYGGMGGTRMAQHAPNWDKLSAYQISEAIKTGDWQPQIDAAAALLPGNVYTTQVNNLANTDWNTVDIVTIALGRNDFTGDNPIGYSTDTTGVTIKGAVNKVITDIHSTYPHIRIVFIPPLFTTDGPRSDGVSQRDVVEAIIERAIDQNCQAIDIYHLAGINATNFSFYMSDPSHPKFPYAGGGESNYNTNLRLCEIYAGNLNAPSIPSRDVRSKAIALTADNQVVPVGNSRFIELTSDNATAGNRTFVLGKGSAPGQEVTLYWNDTDAGELADNGAPDGGGNVRLSATWTPTQYDTLKLVWTGTDFAELSRSAN